MCYQKAEEQKEHHCKSTMLHQRLIKSWMSPIGKCCYHLKFTVSFRYNFHIAFQTFDSENRNATQRNQDNCIKVIVLLDIFTNPYN